MKQDYLDEDQVVQLKQDMESVVMEYMGLKAPMAAPVAAALVEGMRAKMGGKRVYIPASTRHRDMIESRRQLDLKIVSMFNGCNLKEVMAALSVSRATVYRAIDRSRTKLVSVTA